MKIKEYVNQISDSISEKMLFQGAYTCMCIALKWLKIDDRSWRILCRFVAKNMDDSFSSSVIKEEQF